MPAYATNMRWKFPILALTLEFITIILFAVFVVYDDGKPESHAANVTEVKEDPMTLYPSKCTMGSSLEAQWKCMLWVMYTVGLHVVVEEWISFLSSRCQVWLQFISGPWS